MTKGPTLQTLWDDLPEERKQRIEAKTAALEAENLTLQELKKSRIEVDPDNWTLEGRS